MSNVDVTVIMGVYNQYNRNELEMAVKSILNQSLTELEFIIYNDGSDKEETDYLLKLSRCDKRIHLYGRNQNNGLAYSLNECIKYAKGRYIARMDADDISFPERLKNQYEFLESHEEYEIVGCCAQLIDDNDNVWGVRMMPREPKLNDFLAFSPYIHPSVMMRSSIFAEGNLYSVSEDTLRCEDYEFFMRLYGKGCRGYNLQEVLFMYRENKSGYKKRKYKYCIAEAKIRYNSFGKLGVFLPKRLLFTMKPLVVGLIPVEFVYQYHKYKGLLNGNKK